MFIVDSVHKLECLKLFELCSDEIQQIRNCYFAHMDLHEGTLRAETDFYHYLKSLFFAVGGLYMIYPKDDLYICSARIEPYKDGLLLNAVVTAPEFRRQGYAFELLKDSLDKFQGKIVYSHIYRNNIASIKLHEKLGFVFHSDHARMLDGSVRNDHITYIKTP